MLRVECSNPDCRQPHKVPEECEGRSLRCRACGSEFKARSSGDCARASRSGASKPPRRNGGSSPRVGERIGQYEIRSELGSGAFGTVYRAYHPGVDREVALKVPHRGTLSDDRWKERFVREARAAARLFHSNIVPVTDAGEAGGQYYIAYDFIEGETLGALIEREPPSFRLSVWIVGRLAEALHHAYEHGIVHRDVKPENIMVDTEGAPHLMNLGLAHHQDAAARRVNSCRTSLRRSRMMSSASGQSGIRPLSTSKPSVPSQNGIPSLKWSPPWKPCLGRTA